MTKSEKSIAQNRVYILTDLNYIIATAEMQITKVKGVPITDDADIADAVQGYADRVHEILQDLWDLRNSKYLNWERKDAD